MIGWKISALRADVRAGVQSVAKCDAVASAGHILLNDDAFRAVGHGRAGKDAQRLASADPAAPSMACRCFAHDL